MSTFCLCINPCSQTFVRLRFTHFQGLCSNLFPCEHFLESSSPDILDLCETNLENPMGSSNFSVRGPLVQKDSLTHMFGLTVYLKEGLSFVY